MTTTAGQLGDNAVDFIDEGLLHALLVTGCTDSARIAEVLAKALTREALTLEETAALLTADSGQADRILDAARTLRRAVYGNRIGLFAPLHVDGTDPGTHVGTLLRRGHKRLTLVFDERSAHDADIIARCVRDAYDVKAPPGGTRCVDVAAGPLDRDGYRKLKDAGVGTLQVARWTYRRPVGTDARAGTLSAAERPCRLNAPGRAIEAGLANVGITVAVERHDWRFEALALVCHARFLRERYGVDPHTISFPRLGCAAGDDGGAPHPVSDDDYKRLVAVARLTVPQAALICTAGESPQLRREALAVGVTRIDADSTHDTDGYSEAGKARYARVGPAARGDLRPLDTVIGDLLTDGYIPSFCTACHRLGRSGERFMQLAATGTMKQFCTPNALTSLLEYLLHYASPPTLAAGEKLIADELDKLDTGPARQDLIEELYSIRMENDRDAGA